MCQTEKFKEVKYFPPLHFYILTSSSFNTKYYSFLFFFLFLPAGRKIELFKDCHTEKKTLLLKKKLNWKAKLQGSMLEVLDSAELNKKKAMLLVLRMANH